MRPDRTEDRWTDPAAQTLAVKKNGGVPSRATWLPTSARAARQHAKTPPAGCMIVTEPLSQPPRPAAAPGRRFRPPLPLPLPRPLPAASPGRLSRHLSRLLSSPLSRALAWGRSTTAHLREGRPFRVVGTRTATWKRDWRRRGERDFDGASPAPPPGRFTARSPGRSPTPSPPPATLTPFP